MEILAKLKKHGFKNAAVLNEDQGLTRIRTARGWIYERFKSEDEIAAWASKHKPEVRK